MRNFKDKLYRQIEIYGIKSAIKEYHLIHIDNDYKTTTFEGEGNINWNKIPSEFLKDETIFGVKNWTGWITFNDYSWIELKESQNSFWWNFYKMPEMNKKI